MYLFTADIKQSQNKINSSLRNIALPLSCISLLLSNHTALQVQHKPHLQFNHSLLKCCSVGKALRVGVVPFFQSDLIMIDEICTNRLAQTAKSIERKCSFRLD